MMLDRETYKWFYDNIGSRYYNIAIKFFFLPFGGERNCRAKLLEPISFRQGERILDMCCGTGGATMAIAHKAPPGTEIIGIDLSSGQIRVAKRKTSDHNVRFIEKDACSTGFEEGSFDKVFITHALHEMQRDSRLKVLAEAKRVLTENGEVVVLEVDNPGSLLIRFLAGLYFFYWLPFNFETPTRKDMFRRGLENEVLEAGFRAVEKTSRYKGVFQVVQGKR